MKKKNKKLSITNRKRGSLIALAALVNAFTLFYVINKSANSNMQEASSEYYAEMQEFTELLSINSNEPHYDTIFVEDINRNYHKYKDVYSVLYKNSEDEIGAYFMVPLDFSNNEEHNSKFKLVSLTNPEIYLEESKDSGYQLVSQALHKTDNGYSFNYEVLNVSCCTGISELSFDEAIERETEFKELFNNKTNKR